MNPSDFEERAHMKTADDDRAGAAGYEERRR